jgi:Mn-dependent DtxR family transcriptional regulator
MENRKPRRAVSSRRSAQLLEIIKAMKGKPCPTNRRIATRMGYQDESSVAQLLNDLYRRNIVRNISTDRRRRQLKVMATGETTAPSDAPRM